MKRLICISIVICMLFISTPVFAEESKITMLLHRDTAIVNGKVIDIPAPITQNNVTMVPLRFLSETLGYSVTWDQELQQVTVMNHPDLLSFVMGQSKMKVNGNWINLPIAATLINHSVYVPLRPLVESLGKTVSFQDYIITIGEEIVLLDDEYKNEVKEQLSQKYDYSVYQNSKLLDYFKTYTEAFRYAKNYENSKIEFKRKYVIWDSNKTLPKSYNINNVKLIQQMPELPRGCEVTALAMMLLYAGVQVNKMKLAEEVKKDPTSYSKKNGKVYFGNPYDGFVGDMYSFSKPGLGVYHGPIAELAENYLPKRIVDLTGSTFDNVLQSLLNDTPVWTIINVNYGIVPKDKWHTWNTPSGEIDITYNEHSVLLTGYDEHYVYFKDPLGIQSKANRTSFEKGWLQMGSQAITYVK